MLLQCICNGLAMYGFVGLHVSKIVHFFVHKMSAGLPAITFTILVGFNDEACLNLILVGGKAGASQTLQLKSGVPDHLAESETVSLTRRTDDDILGIIFSGIFPHSLLTIHK